MNLSNYLLVRLIYGTHSPRAIGRREAQGETAFLAPLVPFSESHIKLRLVWKALNGYPTEKKGKKGMKSLVRLPFAHISASTQKGYGGGD